MVQIINEEDLQDLYELMFKRIDSKFCQTRFHKLQLLLKIILLLKNL